MLCIRCRHFEAVPDGTHCAPCTAALPVTTPHGDAWLRSPVGLGRATAVLLGVVVAADLFAVGSDVLSYGVWDTIADGGDVPDRAAWVDSLWVAGGVLQSFSMLAAGIVFLVWFHRVRVNAEVFAPAGHRKKRGWAVGGWFVPVVNLWFPRRIALDTWDASGSWNAPRPHGLVDAWWALWLVTLVYGPFAYSAYEEAETAPEIRRAVAQVLVADLVDAAAAVLAAVFVLTLTRMQDVKARSGPGVPPMAAPAVG
ncbi:hypothetical protein GCM10010145_05010 [Streptomyces ruber]|uniref:DUF4328 domain-containing protein n=2 Tax=Streptomyces TaxID=1883 RepID=A0A918EQP0_9ACTN|nr:DUF4328 domain-containing protein [Streptomyces ruber]GGQ40154.1 hypothetical protein GCM10010145_05010 [Streptomyces ruber]